MSSTIPPKKIALSRAARAILKEIQKTSSTISHQQIPLTRAGDELHAYLLFKKSHGRPPTDAMLLNDVLYRIKVSPEILNPLRVFVTDKEWVKLYVKAMVGESYNIPTLAVLRSPKEVQSYEFPQDCCIKPTHLSGAVILRKNGSDLDLAKIQSWFGMNYYPHKREANYRTLQPKVIIEPLIFNSDNVADYKFFCWQGKVKLIQVDRDRQTDLHRLIYSPDWQVQDFTIRYPRATTAVARPANLDEMISVAQTLAQHFSFIRVDLYSNGQSCLVGELTNCPGNASNPFLPLEANEKASQMIFGD